MTVPLYRRTALLTARGLWTTTGMRGVTANSSFGVANSSLGIRQHVSNATKIDVVSASAKGKTGRVVGAAAPELNTFLTVARKAFPIGLCSGTIGACAGIGGATITIPLLCRFLAMKQRDAAGSALFAVCGTVCGSAYIFCKAGEVDTEMASYLAVAGAVTAPFGALLSGKLPSVTLRLLLGSFMMCLAPLLPMRKMLESGTLKKSLMGDVSGAQESRFPDEALLVGAGALVGVISGVLGVSGGPLVTPTVALLSKDGENFHKVLGTSFLAMTLPVLSGSLAYIRSGSVSLMVVPSLLGGTLLGANVGSNLALRLPSEYLQYLFGAFLFLAGFRIFRVPI